MEKNYDKLRISSLTAAAPKPPTILSHKLAQLDKDLNALAKSEEYLAQIAPLMKWNKTHTQVIISF